MRDQEHLRLERTETRYDAPPYCATRERLVRTAAALAALVALGCSGTRSSTYATGRAMAAYTGTVRVVVTAAPAGAQEVGLVTVDSHDPLERAVEEFQRRVGELGGDTGIIDNYSTSFEVVTRSRQESYNCGTVQSPRTCTRTVSYQDEVSTLHLAGRALTTRTTP